MKDVLKNLPPLVDTVTVKVANVTKYDDHQVEGVQWKNPRK